MTELPSVSVVVPTRGRPRKLAECIRALAAQTYPRERIEVLVVDDGGGAPSEEELARSGGGLRVALVRQAHAGPAAARNAGAARSAGELLAFTDDDCRPDPGWVAAFAARAAARPGAAFGGRTVNALGGNRFSTASQLLLAYLYEHYGSRPERGFFFASNNLAVPAAAFRALGGFDPAYPRAAAEDRDFCDRWSARGLELAYVPEALVRHAHALTLASYARQHFDYGRGAARFQAGRVARGRGSLRVEPPSFYLRLLGYPVGRARARATPLLAALLALSQAATAAGFAWERARPEGPRPEGR
jgi:glycosyltransferase involved in cell wall biosynthesis